MNSNLELRMRIELESRSEIRILPNLSIKKNHGLITCCPLPLVMALFCNSKSLLKMWRHGFDRSMIKILSL